MQLARDDQIVNCSIEALRMDVCTIAQNPATLALEYILRTQQLKKRRRSDRPWSDSTPPSAQQKLSLMCDTQTACSQRPLNTDTDTTSLSIECFPGWYDAFPEISWTYDDDDDEGEEIFRADCEDWYRRYHSYRNDVERNASRMVRSKSLFADLCVLPEPPLKKPRRTSNFTFGMDHAHLPES